MFSSVPYPEIWRCDHISRGRCGCECGGCASLKEMIHLQWERTASPEGDAMSPAGDAVSAMGDLFASPNFGICDTTRDVTWFCCRAVARSCAPCGSILLLSRLSVVSVYVKQKEWEIQWKRSDATLFSCRAVAIRCAPSSPIWFSSRFSVVSAYVKQKRMRDSMKS
jgi:hypothetical protein